MTKLKLEDTVKFKWEELKLRIEHYRYYVTIALQANVFFYATTGVVLGFYLKTSDELNKTSGEMVKNHLEFVLLLPILIGAVLGSIFIHGAKLQRKAANSIEKIVKELNKVEVEHENLKMSIKPISDNHLLHLLLLIFGYIFILVGALLITVPFLKASQLSLESILSWERKPFELAALVVLILGRYSTHIFICIFGTKTPAE